MFGAILAILIDTFVLWFILNLISDQNWDDEKLKVLLLTLGITILGGLAANALSPHVGPLALGVFFVVGMVVLCVGGSLSLQRAAIVMAAFMGYKIVWALIVFMMLR